MSKKNSSVILKNCFKSSGELSKIYENFKNKLDKQKKKSYIAAISGGPDSLALAALLKAYSFERKVKLYFVLINHNIRKNSSREASQVKKLLMKHKLKLLILNNKFKINKNIQGQARNMRYKMLINFCKKKKIKTLLTAHNLEDQVETFFIRLSRGSGLTGLSAMKPLSKLNSSIGLFRPLLDVKKKSLIKISKTIFGKYIIDPSNKNEKYLRTKVRNLRKHLSLSGIDYDQIFRSINNLASSKETLEGYLKEVFKKTIKKVGQKEVLINFKKFNSFNDEVKMRVINESIKTLKKNYYNPRSIKVSNLIKNLNKRNFKRSTLGGCLFFLKRDHICLIREKRA